MAQTLKHILCVDDENDILEVAKMALETVGGYQVSTCNSGKEAIEKVAQIDPDVILLDVMMPGIDGPTTYSQLQQNMAQKRIPIIFMTAKVQPKEVASYIGMGAIGVVLKPFDPMKLAEEIETHWKNFQERS